MEKIIEITEDYTTTGVFDRMEVGDVVKIPYEKSRHNGVRTEASRRNRYAVSRKSCKAGWTSSFVCRRWCVPVIPLCYGLNKTLQYGC